MNRQSHNTPDGAEEGIDAMIEASAVRLFSRYGALHDGGRRRARVNEDFDFSAWNDLQDAGLPLAMLDEAHGGVGIKGAVIVARLAGEHALPLPLCEAMAANWLLTAGGLEPAEGPVTIAEHPVQLASTADGWRVSGESRFVPWGRHSELVVTGVYKGRLHVAQVNRQSISVTLGENMAGEPRDLCQFDCALSPERTAALPEYWTPQAAQLLGAALRTAQIAGAARACLAMTVDYARLRRQFGRPIGAFQAVQQLLAVLATHTAAAGVAGDLAVVGAIDNLNPRPIAASKIRAGEAAGAIAAIAHQVHGAIGFTREHSLHTRTHRLWSWRDEFGSESHWSILLGRQLAARGAAALWSGVTEI
jgi:acyl-CoA dehydrogenase